MQKIRLSRHGKHKRPFFRIVLTEHSKPVKSGYKDVLGWFDPIHHEIEADIDKIKGLLENGVQPSARVAKLLFNKSNDEIFKKYFTISDKVRKPRNEKKES